MTTNTRHVLTASLLLLCLSSPAMAAEEIKWEEVTDIPKGLHLPDGVSADILGLQLGMSYDDAKPVFDKLLSENVEKPVEMDDMQRSIAQMQGSDLSPPFHEDKQMISFSVPGGDAINGSFIGQMRLKRELKGSGSRNIHEEITALFSSPSSGHQLLGVERSIDYRSPEDQIHISELVDSLKKKFKAEPWVNGSGQHMRFQFDNGKGIIPANAGPYTCTAEYRVKDQRDVPHINRNGDCDVVLDVYIFKGISENHASSVKFTLSDNERAKANAATDFKFFNDYVKKYQKNTGGAAPKL